MQPAPQQTDIVVIGGGIQGAGVAQAAAAAGYRVLLLEQNAIAAATSSRSSKLIHGGLRYLETLQFSLVRKTLLERRYLLQNAPHLVRLIPFFIPVYADTSRRPWLIRIGLSLYALLGGLRESSRFRSLPRKSWPALKLATENLRVVFQYQDAQTDDAALTRAVIASAQQLGAGLCCPAEFLSAEAGDKGIEIAYRQQGAQRRISASVMVNAAGPWVNQVLAKITPRPPCLEIDLVQGSHLVLDAPAPAGAFYVEAPQDRRAVFIMPWHGKTLIGTTETIYHGDPAKVEPSAAEIEYLLTVFRHYFPTLSERVIDSFAGLRVLPKQNGSPFHRPRDTIVHTGPGRVVSLYGGKLTAYRATAEEVMKRLSAWLPAAKRKADTRRLRLPEPGDPH